MIFLKFYDFFEFYDLGGTFLRNGVFGPQVTKFSPDPPLPDFLYPNAHIDRMPDRSRNPGHSFNAHPRSKDLAAEKFIPSGKKFIYDPRSLPEHHPRFVIALSIFLTG